MATLTVQSIATTGLSPSLVAAAGGGDAFLIGEGKNHYTEVANGDVSATTVTVEAFGGQDGSDLADLAVSVPAGETRKIGPLPKRTYGDVDGKVQLTYSKVTSLTVGAFSIGQFG